MLTIEDLIEDFADIEWLTEIPSEIQNKKILEFSNTPKNTLNAKNTRANIKKALNNYKYILCISSLIQ